MASTDQCEPGPQDSVRSTFRSKWTAEFPCSETFYFLFLLTSTEFVTQGEEEPPPICKGSIAQTLGPDSRT